MMKIAFFTQEEMDDSRWLESRYPEWVKSYPNKWIAVFRKTLAAVGDDAETVEVEAKKKFGPDCTPVIAFIDGGAYIYAYPHPLT